MTCVWWGLIVLIVLLSVLGIEGEKEYTDKERGSAGIIFSILDADKSGGVEREEWASNELMKMEPEHGGDFTDKLQLAKTFARINTNNDASISWDEFSATIPSFTLGKSVQQVHISLTAQNTEMVVMWVTDENTTTSEVQIGSQSGHYTSSFLGYTTTYDVGLVDGWHKIIHTVKVTSLSAASTYYYKCGDSAGGYSPEYHFTTPPPTAPTVYGLVGDMGTYIPMGWAVIKQLTEDLAQFNFSLIIHAGDIAYAGTSGQGEIEEVWDVWGDLIEPVASVVPYMVAIGNHEDYYNRTSFMHRFYMPGFENGGNGNLWYSIDHGNVHWIFFSTQDDFNPGSPQYQWLEKDLIAANSNRDSVAWIVFVTHRPMYCSDEDEYTEHNVGGQIQVALEPILVKYGVDIFFCGHMHMYERVHPVINGTVIQSSNTYLSPKAPMHLVIGTSGAFTDHKYIEPQPTWSAARNGDYGYGKLTVYNNSALHFSFMAEETKSTQDEFWILK